MGQYTKEELEEYQSVFSVFDTDGSGSIGTNELGAAMNSMGVGFTKKELESLIEEVDADGNGEIDFDEFCVCMKQMAAKKGEEEDVIRTCFKVFDQDDTGSISLGEWKIVMSELGGFDEEFIQDMFREVDSSGNGIIEYPEFAQMVRTYLLDDDDQNKSLITDCMGCGKVSDVDKTPDIWISGGEMDMKRKGYRVLLTDGEKKTNGALKSIKYSDILHELTD